MKRIVVQTERPTERSPGAIREGYYRFDEDGKRVYIYDADTRP